MNFLCLALWLLHKNSLASAELAFRPNQIPVAVEEQGASPLKHRGFSIDPVWDVLGPFQIGTREVAWGSDPLQKFGGFDALVPDNQSSFRSSLGLDGLVKWSTRNFQSELSDFGDGFDVRVNLGFPDVDWDLLRGFYGWSTTQYQAWVRGYFDVLADETHSYEVNSDLLIEFSIDRQHFFGGDFYGYRRAPLVLKLHPGRHWVNLRLYRDVRAMGGSAERLIEAIFSVRVVSDDLIVDKSYLVAPDLVDGKLPSSAASVPLRNGATETLEVLAVTSDDLSWHVSSNEQQSLPMKILPGQTRPFVFAIKQGKNYGTELSFRIIYRRFDQERSTSVDVSYELNQKTLRDLHKYTYLLPSGVASYALLRPPNATDSAISSLSTSVPAMLFLHGAGIEIEGNLNIIRLLDGIKNISAWTIIPSGGTSWSGDDWHQWGWADVEASVAAIPQWIKAMQWKGAGFLKSPWLVAGHSNGGQGAWYALTHHPDKVIAAAPVSGYSSIQYYVPYTFWHETDPRRTAVLDAALSSYRHEILLVNAQGVPIAQQHGRDDDNVPCHHSKHLFQLANETGCSSTYRELPVGHVFDGMMTTDFLLRFYRQHLQDPTSHRNQLADFTLIVASPADTSSKSGVLVKQLVDPGQLGKVKGRFEHDVLNLDTSNVHTISISDTLSKHMQIIVNGARLSPSVEGDWISVSDRPERTSGALMGDTARRGNQLGNLDAILRSRGSFAIHSCHVATSALALQISRNLFQYFAADTELFQDYDRTNTLPGNLITVGMGNHVPEGLLPSHPFRLSNSSLQIRDAFGLERSYAAGEHGLGAIFLRPLKDEKLELVVWGTDVPTAAVAARLIPLLTGTGQPDFVVVTGESRWRGIDGALAMGFFDSSWNVSASSFFL